MEDCNKGDAVANTRIAHHSQEWRALYYSDVLLS